MTEKERFQRAFAPLHASPDTMTEVLKMTERKTKRPALRRAATLGLAAALVLALGSVAYASDLGGIQRTVQLWLNGEMTDATLTVKNGHYTVNYTDSEGNERERSGGGVAFEPDGTERALTEEELLADINCPEVTYREDGTVTVYYLDQKLDVTDKFDEDGVCYVQLEGGDLHDHQARQRLRNEHDKVHPAKRIQQLKEKRERFRTASLCGTFLLLGKASQSFMSAGTK